MASTVPSRVVIEPRRVGMASVVARWAIALVRYLPQSRPWSWTSRPANRDRTTAMISMARLSLCRGFFRRSAFLALVRTGGRGGSVPGRLGGLLLLSRRAEPGPRPPGDPGLAGP